MTARVLRLGLAPLLLGATLATAAAAPAKGPLRRAQVCGAAACVDLTGSDLLAALAPFQYAPADAVPVHPLPAAFFRLRLVPDVGDPVVGWYVPAVHAIELANYGGGFVALPRTLADGIAVQRGALRPFPAPRAAAVVVEGRRVPGNALARKLLGRYPTGRLASTAGRWLGIDVAWTNQNPWTGESRFTYHVPSRPLLRPDGGVRLPAALGAELVRLAAR